MQVGCQIWVNETDLLKVAESTLKLWRNWLGLRLALSISGVEDPSRLILAISTSSTVMGWVWNLAAVAALCLRSRCRPLPLDRGCKAALLGGGSLDTGATRSRWGGSEPEATAVAGGLGSAASATSSLVAGCIRWRGCCRPARRG